MNRTILFAEETEQHRTLFKTALRKVGLEENLRLVKDTPEALDYLTAAERGCEDHTRPGLVLLGLKLPELRELEVLRWIREQPALDGIVVIAVAAEPDAQTVGRVYQFRGNSFILEPRRKEGWDRIARAIKEYWFGLNLESVVRMPNATAIRATRATRHASARAAEYLPAERILTRAVLQAR